MAAAEIPIWRTAPFLRLIIPFAGGIMLQWYIGLPPLFYGTVIFAGLVLLLLFTSVRSFVQYRNYWITGILVNLVIAAAGGLLSYYKDIRNDPDWMGKQAIKQRMVITLEEPLSEKEKTFKSTASIVALENAPGKIVTGRLIVYFQKDSLCRALAAYSRILFAKPPQQIRNTGNPGAFDYRRYCLFQGISHQVYLKRGEYIILPPSKGNLFGLFLLHTRQKVVAIIRSNIDGVKEAGLAEALLIGYKDDLDKTLVQSYSNTGVVHIIAISGLHLGLIYWLLTLMTKPLGNSLRSRWLKAVLIISGLWIFSFLAGGSPSVLRSAVMFSFIVAGSLMERKTFIYNSLAASAFLLLCYDPFWLWDAGFQLSYTAVLSIVVFRKPIYNWFYARNKLLNFVWELAAISIAAQILTTPVSLYLFHQFPNYFLITNVVAVPLSSLVVLGELLLCAVSFSSPAAHWLGYVLRWLIKLMNNFIAHMEHMPYALTNGIQLSVVQVLLLYAAIAAAGWWILQKNNKALVAALCALFTFFAIGVVSLVTAKKQCILVVYSIPPHRAIDIVNGSRALLIADTGLVGDAMLQNFHLKPARIANHIRGSEVLLTGAGSSAVLKVMHKRIFVMASPFTDAGALTPSPRDIVIVTGNPSLSSPDFSKMAACRIIIFDATNTEKKIVLWKQQCDKLNILCYSVPEKGAFILHLN